MSSYFYVVAISLQRYNSRP